MIRSSITLVFFMLYIPLSVCTAESTNTSQSVFQIQRSPAREDALRDIIANEKEALKKQGFIRVSHEEIRFYTLESLSNYFGNPTEIMHKASFKASDFISKKKLNQEGLIGLHPYGPEKLATVVSVYSTKDGMTVALEETDIVNSGISVTQVKDLLNTDVNGNKGTISYRRAQNGMSLVLLSWVTETRLMKLSLAGKDLQASKQSEALEIARSIIYK